MKWSEKTWLKVQPVFIKILEHPFIQGLIDGTLDKEKFLFYIQQDALYLAQYGKVLAGIASKLDNREQMKAFLSFASDSISVENALHEFFLTGADLSKPLEPSPSCLLYTSYLHKQLSSSTVEVALATVLPCFWIYKEVGDYILSNQIKGNNPYQMWIDTYGGDDFARSVQLAIDICDESAYKTTNEMQELMTNAFVMCSKMEWMFWDSAWQVEQWKV